MAFLCRVGRVRLWGVGKSKGNRSLREPGGRAATPWAPRAPRAAQNLSRFSRFLICTRFAKAKYYSKTIPKGLTKTKAKNEPNQNQNASRLDPRSLASEGAMASASCQPCLTFAHHLLLSTRSEV